jgi:hypothetical protein
MSKIILVFLIVIGSIHLVGCSMFGNTNKSPIIHQSAHIAILPEPIIFNQIKLSIVKANNCQETLDKLPEPVLFCLSGTDYKSLVYDFSLIEKFILEQKAILQLYNDYYESNKPLDKKE